MGSELWAFRIFTIPIEAVRKHFMQMVDCKLSGFKTKASEGVAESAASDIAFPAFMEWLNEMRTLDEELQVSQHVFSISKK